MTSPLPLIPPSPLPPPPAAGIGWIDLATAAARAGYSSAGVIRRFHLQRFIEAGTARMEKPPGGGKARWLVREDADPAFARVKFPEQLSAAAALRTMTTQQRAVINDRLRLIRRWETERAAGITLGLSAAKITAHFLDKLLIDEGRKLGRTQLYEWISRYRRDGIPGLADKDWTPAKAQGARSLGDEDPFFAEIKKHYLTLRRLKLTVCHEIACLKADENGWEKRSYKTCQRFIDSIPRPVLLKMRFGEEAHENDAQPHLIKDYTALASNEIWCGDHHQMDVFVAIGERASIASGEIKTRYVRPWLTAWMDERSRKIVGWTIFAHDPNSDTIMAALKNGIGEHGVPEHVRIDNGKDYDSYALHGRTKQQRRKRIRLPIDEQQLGVFAQLGIGTKHVMPYHGQSKPIERFFGTLEDRFGRTWDTYCGSSPENRPEDFAQKLDAGRAPGFEDFVTAFALWLENDYHARGHAGDGMDGKSPNQVYAQNLAAKRTAPNELLDVLLLKPSRPVKVHQNGVTWNGLTYGQYEHALHQMTGKEVVLRAPPNGLDKVSVWTLDGRFICIAPANGKVPANADPQILREALAMKKSFRKAQQQYHQARPFLYEDTPDLMTRAAARKHRSAGTDRVDPTLPPASAKPVQTPLAAGAKQYQEAVARREMRIAVGAESSSGLGAAYASSIPEAQAGSVLGDVTDYLKYRPEGRDE